MGHERFRQRRPDLPLRRGARLAEISDEIPHHPEFRRCHRQNQHPTEKEPEPSPNLNRVSGFHGMDDTLVGCRVVNR